jgi:hypothetical protein
MKNWRDVLPVHPAADLFPLMSEAELRELGEDIKKNGLLFPIIACGGQLLDGRNRLDAMALVGIKFKIERRTEQLWIDVDAETKELWCNWDVDYGHARILEVQSHLDDKENGKFIPSGRAYDYARSANLYRRQLTAEQRRELITKFLKAKPEASDRQIGAMAKADGKTVAKVRGELEGRAEIPHDEKRTDAKGRKQPAKKPKKATAKLGDGSTVKIDDLGAKAQAAIAAQGEITIDDRKRQMAALDPEPEPVETHPAEETPQGRVVTKAELMPLLQAIISEGDSDLHDGDLELYDTLTKARDAINHLRGWTTGTDAVSKALDERAQAEKRQRRARRKAAAISAKAAA